MYLGVEQRLRNPGRFVLGKQLRRVLRAPVAADVRVVRILPPLHLQEKVSQGAVLLPFLYPETTHLLLFLNVNTNLDCNSLHDWTGELDEHEEHVVPEGDQHHDLEHGEDDQRDHRGKVF